MSDCREVTTRKRILAIAAAVPGVTQARLGLEDLTEDEDFLASFVPPVGYNITHLHIENDTIALTFDDAAAIHLGDPPLNVTLPAPYANAGNPHWPIESVSGTVVTGSLGYAYLARAWDNHSPPDEAKTNQGYYHVAAPGSGEWAGLDNQIVYWDGARWNVGVGLAEYLVVLDYATGTEHYYQNGAWQTSYYVDTPITANLPTPAPCGPAFFVMPAEMTGFSASSRLSEYTVDCLLYFGFPYDADYDFTAIENIAFAVRNALVAPEAWTDAPYPTGGLTMSKPELLDLRPMVGLYRFALSFMGD